MLLSALCAEKQFRLSLALVILSSLAVTLALYQPRSRKVFIHLL